MTKFYNWLNEEEDVDIQPILDDIGKKCGPYIRVLTSSTVDKFLLSGRKNKPSYFKGTVRKDRTPRDTPKHVHNYVDELFYDEFGIRARSNTLFCSMDAHAVKTYGDPYLIFPIGQYKLIWSPEISDFYGDIIQDAEGYDERTIERTMEREIEDAVETYKITKVLPDISTYSEIMLYCKKYYALNYYLFLPKVIEWLVEEYNAKIDSNFTYYQKV